MMCRKNQPPFFSVFVESRARTIVRSLRHKNNQINSNNDSRKCLFRGQCISLDFTPEFLYFNFYFFFISFLVAQCNAGCNLYTRFFATDWFAKSKKTMKKNRCTSNIRTWFNRNIVVVRTHARPLANLHEFNEKLVAHSARYTSMGLSNKTASNIVKNASH